MIFYYLGVILMIVFILQGVAFMVLLERHFLGGSQVRIGPNKVGWNGLVQAILDGLKLMKKEHVFLCFSTVISFFFVPVLSFMVMIMFWFSLPYIFSFFSFEYSGIFFMCVMGISVFPIMMSGILSGGKYSFLAGLRSSCQSYSYEIAFSLYFLIFLVFNSGYCLYLSFNFCFFLFFLPFFCLVLIDLHRAPFDFTECESELVSGINLEFSSVGFACLFLGEYGNLLYFCFLISIFFFDMNFFFFYIMVVLVVFARSAYPRFRYDKLMNLCWNYFLPIGFYFFGFFFVFFIL
uniref:NADH-ubiquinone oxidoreductase chain 1 n=1 Tax=Thelazia callipaeda TaxID=103827 RepID=A0A343IPE0_THECL|nr:NADH dehydrogenase subunit 1 [Thelazia callipaeda]